MSAPHIKESPASVPATPPGQEAERVIHIRDLLAGSRRVWIEHADARYLLQVTRSGKLILTK